MFVAVGAWLIGTAEHYTTSVDRPIVQIGRWGQTSEGVVHRDQAVDAAFGRASGEVPPAVDVCTGVFCCCCMAGVNVEYACLVCESHVTQFP